LRFYKRTNNPKKRQRDKEDKEGQFSVTFQEPFVVGYFKDKYERSPPVNPDEDVVLEEIFQRFQEGAKGFTGEYVGCRLLQRSSRGALGSFFSDAAVKCGISQNNILFRVMIIPTAVCGTYKDFGISPGQIFSEQDSDHIIRPSTSAKPDVVAFPVIYDDGKNTLVPCCVQAKAHQKRFTMAELEEALKSLDPVRFFVGAPKLKLSWEQEWENRPDFFESYIRIVFAFGTVSEDVYAFLSAYNAKYPEQPILVVHPIKLVSSKLANSKLFYTQEVPESKGESKCSIDDYPVVFNENTFRYCFSDCSLQKSKEEKVECLGKLCKNGNRVHVACWQRNQKITEDPPTPFYCPECTKKKAAAEAKKKKKKT